jgi:hypothetical protein
MTIIGMTLVFGSTVPNARADEDHTCTLGSLEGPYGFISTGTLIAVGPIANVGVITFDGEGNLSQHLTNSRNGVIMPVDVTGTYTVNPNCTGSWIISNGNTADFVIVAGGREVMFIRTVPGTVITGILTKQSLEHKDGR